MDHGDHGCFLHQSGSFFGYFNLPGPFIKISPINNIATSKSNYFCVFFFLMWHRTVTKGGVNHKMWLTPRWQQSQFSCTCWKNQMTKRRGRMESHCGLTQEARGEVTAGHCRTDTHSEICASMSRHGRKCSGPYGIVDIATTQGGPLKMPFSSIFVSNGVIPPACASSQTFSLHCCFALERLQFSVSLITSNYQKRAMPTIIQHSKQ